MKISYDLHIHSCLSPCGSNDMTPNNIVNMAKLIGLDAIAVSDHNSALNLPAVFKVASECELTVVPAIEVCTNEEVHMLCLIPTLDEVMCFSKEIYQFLPNIENDPTVFGNQLIVDKNDKLIGVESKLLINALEIGIEKVIEIVNKYDGIAIPAHVDKSSYSIISNLGFIPLEYHFTCVEVKNPLNKVDFDGLKITNSDAHYLEHLSEPVNFIDVKENTPKEIINYLKNLH